MKQEQNTNQKLYRVVLRGMRGGCSGVSYGVSYVVASDPTEAYNKVREFLDAKDLGFRHERELSQIDLLAEAYQYNNVGCMLYL